MAANKTDFIKTGREEYIKFYMTYDASDRLEYVYEARANAAHGDYALRTQYTYWTTTTRVKQMAETASTWNSAYDIP